MSYARPISEPKNRREGLLNFVQMVINQIEANNPQEALYLAVDLLDTLSGKANPFASCLEAPEVDPLKRQVDELRRQHVEALSEAVDRARAEGMDLGQKTERARVAALLGLAP